MDRSRYVSEKQFANEPDYYGTADFSQKGRNLKPV